MQKRFSPNMEDCFVVGGNLLCSCCNYYWDFEGTLSDYVSLGCMFVTASPGFRFVFLVLAKRLARKNVSKMTCFVSNGMQNFSQCQC